MISLHKNVDDDLLMQVPQVKIQKLNKVMKDLGFLVGLSFMKYDDYVKGTYDTKKTSKEIVKTIQKFCWKRIHIEECIEKVQRGSAKSQGASILKKTKTGGNGAKINTSQRKNSDLESETKKSQTNRPETGASEDSKSSEQTKKTTKTLKTEQTEKTEKTERESDDEKESDGKTEGTPTNKLRTQKPVVKEESDNRRRVIRFEDEAFQLEKSVKELDANLFSGYLIEFFDEEPEVLVPTTDHTDTSKFHTHLRG